MTKIKTSEAVYGFADWLISLDDIGGSEQKKSLAEYEDKYTMIMSLASKFCHVHNLELPSGNFRSKIKYPEEIRFKKKAHFICRDK